MDYTELVRELNTELYERFGEVEKGLHIEVLQWTAGGDLGT